MKMPSGEWASFAFTLLSNRNIQFEKLQPPQYSGEILTRVAQRLTKKKMDLLDRDVALLADAIKGCDLILSCIGNRRGEGAVVQLGTPEDLVMKPFFLATVCVQE